MTATPITPDARFVRYSSLLPREKIESARALIIGVGAIGRQIASALATMGVGRIALIDPDIVAPVNLGTQGYAPAEVDQPKVEATAAVLSRLNPGVEVTPIPERIQDAPPDVLGSTGPGGPLTTFACPDNMKARRFAYNRFGSQGLFIDTRMGAETVRVIAVDPSLNPGYYRTTLHLDSESFEGPCTARSTYYAALVAAGIAVSRFAAWLKGEEVLTDAVISLPAMEWTNLNEAPSR